MTIDSSWLQSFKEDARECFTPHCSFKPSAVFCDGQIHLMQAPPQTPQSWDSFIHRQFLRPVQKFFGVCDTVILAFDNYKYVPASKAMTQSKRKKTVPIIDFAQSSCLPCMVPQGEMWLRCILNRTFKAKVIELIINRLPLIALSKFPTKQLIIDYKEPTLYTLTDGVVTQKEIDGFGCMGEADVKFVRYADLFQKLIVDSIDGDSVPIALLHHEMRLSQGLNPPKVSIYRMEINLGEKRKKGRSYEYLDVHLLYNCLRTAVFQSNGRVKSSHTDHEIRMLVHLMALTGTDFSRNFPFITGKFVFEQLPNIWTMLSMSYDPYSSTITPFAENLISLLYHLKFPKHSQKTDLQSCLSQLQSSKLSQSLKGKLPDLNKVQTTIKNVNWVMEYWKCETAYPNPINPMYGYCVKGGVPQYADT